MNLTICILSALVGAILEYLYIKNSRILVNRPIYQYFNHVDFYVGNRRKPKSKLKDGCKEDLIRLVNELEYDFNKDSYQVVASNRLGVLLDNIHTHQYKLSEDELRAIIKHLDSYMGLKRQDVLDILEIEAILKEKNSKKSFRTNKLNFENPWIKTAFIILSCLSLLAIYSAYKMYWPVGDEQVLFEKFASKKQNCIITVVHKKRCEHYHGWYQNKKDFQKYVKGINYMYCNCVNFRDIELLDAYSKKNRSSVAESIISDYEKSEGGFDIDKEFDSFEEWYDDSDRGHNVYFGYDLSIGKYKKISSKDILEEYYNIHKTE